jgi:hypothetical protein
VDLNAKKKVNEFIDRRFGEHDQGLSLEDKAMLRFQKERMVCCVFRPKIPVSVSELLLGW